MVNYANSKIYKLVCNQTGNIYVGSTTKKYLSSRMAEHVSKYKQFQKGEGKFITSFRILESNDYSIVLLERVENCVDKDQLHARERHYIEALDCVNKIVVGRTKKEYYDANKVVLAEYQKQYYSQNNNAIREKKKQSHQCPCGGKYTTNNKSQHEKTTKHIKYMQL